MKKIYIASDHAGYSLKNFIFEKLKTKFDVMDLGTNKKSVSVNYPIYAHKLSKMVSKKKTNVGILVCGSGYGVSIAANRFKNIRAVVCRTAKEAEMSRKHNDANVLCLGADFTTMSQAKKIVKAFFTTEFEGGRHKRRVKKLERVGE